MTIAGTEFRFDAKSLHPFDPAIVFLAKAAVNYRPDAPQVRITHPVDGTVWEVGEWMTELSDDPAMVDLLDVTGPPEVFALLQREMDEPTGYEVRWPPRPWTR